jgi:hypothetical protein
MGAIRAHERTKTACKQGQIESARLFGRFSDAESRATSAFVVMKFRYLKSSICGRPRDAKCTWTLTSGICMPTTIKCWKLILLSSGLSAPIMTVHHDGPVPGLDDTAEKPVTRDKLFNMGAIRAHERAKTAGKQGQIECRQSEQNGSGRTACLFMSAVVKNFVGGTVTVLLYCCLWSAAVSSMISNGSFNRTVTVGIYNNLHLVRWEALPSP